MPCGLRHYPACLLGDRALCSILPVGAGALGYTRLTPQGGAPRASVPPAPPLASTPKTQRTPTCTVQHQRGPLRGEFHQRGTYGAPAPSILPQACQDSHSLLTDQETEAWPHEAAGPAGCEPSSTRVPVPSCRRNTGCHGPLPLRGLPGSELGPEANTVACTEHRPRGGGSGMPWPRPSGTWRRLPVAGGHNPNTCSSGGKSQLSRWSAEWACQKACPTS